MTVPLFLRAALPSSSRCGGVPHSSMRWQSAVGVRDCLRDAFVYGGCGGRPRRRLLPPALVVLHRPPCLAALPHAPSPPVTKAETAALKVRGAHSLGFPCWNCSWLCALHPIASMASGQASLLPLLDLNPSMRRVAVCARVARVWEFNKDSKFSHLDVVFIDEQGNKMYAEIAAGHADKFRPQLQEGNLCLVRDFFVQSTKRTSTDGKKSAAQKKLNMGAPEQNAT